jgi:hypothetical protein
MRRRARQAGKSDLRQWRARRRRTIRREWRFWSALVAFQIATIVGLILAHGAWQLVSAMAFGANLMLLVVGWEIGGDVRSLTWIWGQVGEEQTEDALLALGAEWKVVHDIPRRYGNWDHVAIGPPGVFMLETKNYSTRAVVEGDRLSFGRYTYEGKTFRGAAKALSAAIGPNGSHSAPWAQAVVVIWGEFPPREVVERDVVYLSGDRVAEWLSRQPAKLAEKRVESLADRVEALKR